MKHKKLFANQLGYLLPATILLSLAVAIVAGTFLRYTASTNLSLNEISYQSIAEEAARAGIAYADSCLSQDATWTASNPLRPSSNCTGGGTTGSQYVVTNGNEWRSTFSVAPPNAQNIVISTGTVEILQGGVVVKRVTETSHMSLGNRYTTYPIASGEVITHIKAQNTGCAIANGKLYCWGRNSNGEVGDGTSTNRTHPTLVQGALAGKTVTAVDVSDVSTCAIGDGIPYCWGQNLQGQLGSGNRTTYRQPTNNVPIYSSGDLSGKFVTDISTAPMNNPAIHWPLAIAAQHSCALSANGAMACWGSNAYRQLGHKACIGVMVFGLCVGVSFYPDNASPEYVAAYADNIAPIGGKKAERIGASSHDSCIVSQGRMYCMGVEAPLSPICGTFPSPLFLPANVVSIDLNPCTALYSTGYDMSAKDDLFDLNNFHIKDKVIDPETWQLGANIACGMANSDFFCVGNGPTVGFQWLASFNPPWREISNADVTSHDNGDNEAAATLDGMYCAIDKGIAKCMTSLAAGLVYSGGAPVLSWGPIRTTNMDDNTPRKIAAGTTFGCVVANGKLFCWGFGTSGRLANGSESAITYPTRTGTGGDTPIGTDEGTYAADGPVTSGGRHSCGIINSKLFCWGNNSHGQLGTNNNIHTSDPQAVPDFTGRATTKVSAGENHTCATVEGKLYCWGQNTYGQLGLGNTTNTNKPTLVEGALANKRITDISAGSNSTCAIAAGEVYCWGQNNNYQLGNGSTTNRNTPTKVLGAAISGKAATSVSVSSTHACAAANADLYCWGNNAQGQIGDNTTSTRTTPTLITAGAAGTPLGPNGMRPSVSKVAVGEDFSCAIINATVKCWGSTADGRIGRGTTTRTPQPISGAAGNYYATDISAGTAHACALIHGDNSADNGNIWCWGRNTNGQLGNGNTTNTSTPQRINGGHTTIGSTRRVATSISAGSSSTCSVANGVILCWGNRGDGRLGSGIPPSDRTTPTSVNAARFNAPYLRGPVF